ncbi:thioredoxin family protein [Kitasatospora sp. NPDC002227]|uniref:thioredoxin family protein n=1 Tax=Kitasatospora sp. NPDC002227 TaxID=3154773 RepID=UPI00332326EB
MPTSTAASGSADGGYDAARNAETDIKVALAEAAKGNREVLLDFGANWCPDCRALDLMYRAPQVAPVLAKNYVVVPVDVGRFDHNVDLAARYVDLRTSGIPALVVLGADGKVRTATDDGSFSSARSMTPGQVSAFLAKWAPAGQQ